MLLALLNVRYPSPSERRALAFIINSSNIFIPICITSGFNSFTTLGSQIFKSLKLISQTSDKFFPPNKVEFALLFILEPLHSGHTSSFKNLETRLMLFSSFTFFKEFKTVALAL